MAEQSGLRREDLQRLALVHDPATTKLYEVLEAPRSKTVSLIDVASDDDDPRLTSMLVEVAVERLHLVRHGPHPGDTATELEWGKCGSD